MLSPSNGFVLAPASDPTGHGQETLGILFVDSDGSTKRVGVYIVNHNSAGPILVLGPADSDPAYTLTASPTALTVPGSTLATSVVS